MTRPRIVVAPHARDLDTVLGRLHASIVYDQYCEKIVAAGGQPLVAWPGSPDVDDLAAAADAIVLIGGGDVAPGRFGMAAEASAVDHVRDEFETRLVLTAKEHATPVLGVCRGAQILNVALGGTLREVEGHRQAGRPDAALPFRQRRRGDASVRDRRGIRARGELLPRLGPRCARARPAALGYRCRRDRGDRVRRGVVGAGSSMACGAARRSRGPAPVRRARGGGDERVVSSDRTDVLIVGAGASGGVVGRRLVEAGFRRGMPRAGRVARFRRHIQGQSPTGSCRRYAGGRPIRTCAGIRRTIPSTLDESEIVPLMWNGVGGSTILYAGDWPRMTPSDFRVRTLDGVADDWPL